MYFFVTLLLIALLILYDYLRKQHPKEVLKKSTAQGQSSTLPLIGDALKLVGLNSENVFEFIKKNVSNKAKTSYVWNFHRLQIFSTNIKDFEFIFTSQTLIDKNFVQEFTEWLGNGILLSSGKRWHQRRKMITPTFHFQILEQFVEVFERQGTVLANKLYKYADGKTVIDIYPHLGLMALDIISETAMGVSVGAQTNGETHGFAKAVKDATRLLTERIRIPIFSPDIVYRLVQPNNYKLLKDSIKYMQDFTRDIIQKRRSILEKEYYAKKENKVVDDDIGTKKRAGLLDVLLQATIEGEPLTDDDIREEVDTFMFAGHDTTSSGVSFALYAIARHPEVQKRLFEEIRTVIGDDKERTLTLRELQELKYLDCVLKETMRFYPPVPLISRRITKDSNINGQIYPAGTIYAFSIYWIMHDPDNFEDPFVFNPERFADGNEKNIKTYSYVPFSAGPRNCIGQKFAQLEMKSVISKILRHFELLPLGPEVILSATITMKSKNGINIGLKPRL